MTRPAPQVSPARDFERLIRSLDSHEPWRVFADFCEMGALALSNRVLKSEEREAQYLKLTGRYKADELPAFAQMLACVCIALAEAEGQVDFLGDRFQALEMANHWRGQFFTPFPMCQLMADLTLDGNVEGIIRTQGFVTVQEPACGAGAMVIAAADVLRRRQIDPSMHMWVTAIDVDSTAAHMAYIQLSLLGIPAEVIVGDTLRMEIRHVWRTPMHHLGMWDLRLRARHRVDVVEDSPALAPVEVNPAPAGKSQLRLF